MPPHSKKRQKTLPTCLLQQSTTELLQLAASLCQAWFAVLQVDGRAVTANDPGVPLDVEEALAARAATREETLVVLDDAEMEGARGIRFYAAVRLGDPAGGVRGRLAILDDHPRRLSNQEKERLIQIAVQITRSIQIEELFLTSQEQQRLLAKELEQLQQLTCLGRLSAQMAHEFNNVLMGIQPVVDVIRRHDHEDPQMVRLLDLVGASISRGKRITTDILRFGRPAQVVVHPVKVQELIRQVAEELRPMLPEGIALVVKAAEAPLYVSADRAQLSQVLINLALNAKDAMHAKGGTLTIGVPVSQRRDSGQGFIHFAVTDTGEGIDSENLPHIFEPLFTTKRSGTGLGLSVVSQIVAAHGGHISVDSEAGRGTTFHMFIPAIADPGSRAEVDDQETTVPPQKLCVLLVDDDEAVACGLQLSLEEEGMDVQVAGDGAHVLPFVSEFGPDVIVLDLNLPDDDGRKVYERIAAQSAVPVIFSSGHLLEREIETLLDNPRTAFLMKPYSTQELLHTIHHLVNAKEAA